jgi:hypothetical protein
MTAHRWFGIFGSRGCQSDRVAAKDRRPSGRRLGVPRGGRSRTTSIEQLEDRTLLSITLNSAHLQLTIGTNSAVTGIMDPVTHTSYLATPNSFGTLVSNGQVKYTTSCSPNNTTNPSTLTLGFEDGTIMTVGVQYGEYFVFTINSITPVPTQELDLNFPTSLASHVDVFAGIFANDSYAVFSRSLTPGVDVRNSLGGYPGFFANYMTNRDHMIGSSFALGGSVYGASGSGVLSTLKDVIINELPELQSDLGGPWAADASAAINRESYVFANVTEDNVNDWISLAKKGDIDMLFLDGMYSPLGHYGISPTAFPHGLDGLKSVVDQIHDAGLSVGVHTLTTFIDTFDSYVTPIPDPDLAKDASFTLASAIATSSTTIYVNETIPATLPTSMGIYGGNVLQIGNELIQYTGYMNSGTQHYFTGCTRGVFSTVQASHSSGSTVPHMVTFFGYFLPDSYSDLAYEIAGNMAVSVNYCGIDMVYLDGSDQPVGGSAGRGKVIADFVSQIDHSVRIETASPGMNYTWTFYSNAAAFDGPSSDYKSFIDYHVAYNNTNLYLPTNLGWFAPYNSVMPDDWEYLCAKAIGTDSALSFVYMPVVATNGRQNDYLAMWAKYQSITVDAAMKAKLAVPGNEFHLETLPDGSLHLVQVKYAEHTVAALTGGTQTWTVNNPYVLQLPTMRIQALANIVNPQVTIGSSTITFSVTLQTGQYIEFNSMTDCKVYSQNGFYLQSITPTGAIPILVSGNNTIIFNCTPPGSYASLAEVTIASYDMQPANWDATTLGSWNFDERSGTTAVDASPYLNNGTLSANVTRVAGKSGFGTALQFNGTNTSVTIPASSSLTGLVGSFSVDLWFKYSGAGTAGKDSWTLLSKNASTSTSNDPVNIYVRASDYHLCARVGNGSTSYVLDSGVAVNNGVYHYVAVVYDDAAKTYKLYLDNQGPVVQAVPSSWLIARNANAVKLGYWPGLSNYFNGTIDQVQILSRPLSQTEVQNRYGNQMPTVIVTSPANNATIQAPMAVLLAASVTDTAKVAFYQGSTWIAEGMLQTNGTFAATWNVQAADWDAYAITAKATDSNGAITISSAVNITIAGAEARWTFDAFSSLTTSDATGNSHTGMLANGPTWTAGILNGALAFNGSNSYVSVPAPTGSPLEYIGGGMTLSTWVYVNPTETSGAFLISKPWNGGGEYNYFLQLRSDRYLTFHLGGNSSYDLVAGNGPLSTNAWHHVAVTVDTVGAVTFYVDGVNAGSGRDTITNWTPSKGNAHLPLVIGTVYPYGSGWSGDPILTFNGKMDDVRFYTHALSAEAIAEQARCPVALWKFDETSGVTASDSTGNGYNGTLINGSAWTTGGRFDGAISFDGSNDYISVPYIYNPTANDTALEYKGGVLTLGAWVYADAQENDGGYILSKEWNGTQNNYRLSLNANKTVRFGLGGATSANPITSLSPLSSNAWHYVAATADAAGNMTLYVDGIVAVIGTYSSTITWGMTDNDVPLTIGGSSSGAGPQSFKGRLDNVEVWNSVLSQADIEALAIDAPPPVVAAIVNRQVFYNNSHYDDPSHAFNDDNAIATNKTALLPNRTASLANCTTYSNGINGIMVDIAGLAGRVPTAGDFVFKFGNTDDPSTWSIVTSPATVAVPRAVAGPVDTKRVEITWANGDLKNGWLQVTVLANANTGLAGNDVFYFGNSVGDTGNSTNDANVTGADVIGVRNNTGLSGASIDNVFDINRDGNVTGTDVILSRNNTGFSLDWLAAPSPLVAADGEVALVAANREVESRIVAAPPSTTQLQRTVKAALARWAGAGLSAQILNKMKTVSFVIADLPAAELGMTSSNRIIIDQDAAGHGWFIDPTPRANQEFRKDRSTGGLRAVNPAAVDRIDLLTVVLHELGHVVGLDDLISSAPGGLMSPTLRTGVRLMPSFLRVDVAFGRNLD